MKTRCEICNLDFNYDSVAPRFCQNCGRPLNPGGRRPDGTDPLLEMATHVESTVPPTPLQEENLDNHPDIGAQIDEYRLDRPIGSGGMGVVWKATEGTTGRVVALKRLNHQMLSDEDSVKRFLREAKLAAQISHPRVTFIYGAGEVEGQPYIVMELMPGDTLADLIDKNGPLGIRQSVDRTLNVIDGLAAAHRMGVIHRDVKPSNCFLDADQSVKIGDFGLSKSLGSNDASLTQTGTFMGTPSYSAPEQVRGEEVDARTDIYAIGATLYCLLTGQSPFIGDAMSVTAQIVSDQPTSPRQIRPDIHQDLDETIMRCLEKDPTRRFDNLEQLKNALIPFASHGTSLANFGRRLAAFMTDYLVVILFPLLLLGMVGTYLVTQSDLGDPSFTNTILPRYLALFAVLKWAMLVLYFAIMEGRTGRTLGKRLMGLTVVNRQGQRPGFWRALLRSVAVPGCFGITLAWLLYDALATPISLNLADWLVCEGQLLLVFLIPTTICVSTMRDGNHLRGLHGFLSGTRVVRITPNQHSRIYIPIVQPQANTIEMQEFGPYRTHDLLERSEDLSIFLGHDQPLDRYVWVITGPKSQIPKPGRLHLARATRPRWLAGGEKEGQRWDAYEAVRGAPIQILTGAKYRLGWQQYRDVLWELAQELRSGIDDGTLPEELSLAQIWLDEGCHTKLIDRPLVSIVIDDNEYAHNTSQQSKDDSFRAVSLLQELADLLLRTKVFPISAQQFLEQLCSSLKDRDTLDWAIEELEQLRKRMGDLGWDSRIGVLAVTVGFEGLIYAMLTLAIFMVVLFWLPISIFWSLAAAFFASTLLPFVLNFWLRGPVFRLMDIDICSRRGKQASRLMAATRNTLAWLPLIVTCGCFVAISGALIAEVRAVEPAEGTFASELLTNRPLFYGLAITMIAAMATGIGGAIYSVWKPRRGIQDRIFRTLLQPR
ncbi:MAG: protein kinase [Planctomycetota bacterium]|nr:protein kinase [Planctomycetota bacterium]